MMVLMIIIIVTLVSIFLSTEQIFIKNTQYSLSITIAVNDQILWQVPTSEANFSHHTPSHATIQSSLSNLPSTTVLLTTNQPNKSTFFYPPSHPSPVKENITSNCSWLMASSPGSSKASATSAIAITSKLSPSISKNIKSNTLEGKKIIKNLKTYRIIDYIYYPVF